MGRLKKRDLVGADDIYETKNSIAVRRVSTKRGRDGSYSVSDKTTYYPKTEEVKSKVRSIYGRIRFGRKS